jgi:transposase InsO family protein
MAVALVHREACHRDRLAPATVSWLLAVAVPQGRSPSDLWLKEVMGIQGLPIPYGAPNANPHVERFHRTLRAEALNHFIFLSAQHVLRVCRDYAEYYNRARPSQALHAIPDPYPELSTPVAATGGVVALPVLGGVIHDYRRAA